MCNLFNTLLHFIAISTSCGVPLKRDDCKIVFKDEKRYPNGSVVGRYTYKDRDGTPVHVKYFADDSSYGLELNSVKVLAVDSGRNISKVDDFVKSADIFEELDNVDSLLGKDYYKNNSTNPYEVLNTFSNKNINEKHKSKEYEIFSENNLNPLNKYNKEKVRVYVDKNKRKVRNSNYLYKPS